MDAQARGNAQATRATRGSPGNAAGSGRAGHRHGATAGEVAFFTAVPGTLIEQETATEDQVEQPWNVVVHNDPVNLMSYVAQVFQKVFGYSRQRAEKHMLEVHRLGRSILWTGGRERGELYVQQLHGWLLLATLERTS